MEKYATRGMFMRFGVEPHMPPTDLLPLHPLDLSQMKSTQQARDQLEANQPDGHDEPQSLDEPQESD